MAKLGRFTFSFDGVGQTHSLVRGKENFFEKTERSIQTLIRLRKERQLSFVIRLKTVVMKQNLEDVCRVAQYAQANGVEVFYQPIEQNYNSQEDPNWFKTSPTWPNDTSRAVSVVDELLRLKAAGVPIVNSVNQLDAMKLYFQDPAGLRLATQAHSAHEKKLLCSALTTLQIQANGDVTTCTFKEAVGNIKSDPIKKIWTNRPQWWDNGCCLGDRTRKSELGPGQSQKDLGGDAWTAVLTKQRLRQNSQIHRNFRCSSVIPLPARVMCQEREFGPAKVTSR
jgi:MoaA/NifB/PqqE/SkfB family radical SAM enzyme